jgi:hypothetical protein
MCLADGRETMDEIRRDVRENRDEAHPDNVAWVDAQNNHLAEIGEQGGETMDDIRRNVRENDPDNVAWVNAQNNRLHQIASMAAGWVGCNDVVVPGFLA